MTSSPAVERLWVVALILAATVLRAYSLDAHSLWTDEGLSFYRATKDLDFLLSGRIDVGLLPTTDVQPPLYFLLLKAWFLTVGIGTWQAKALSLLAALPTIPLTWALARAVFRAKSRWTARVAAVLAAASPAYLWYAQEVRHYTLLVSLGALAVYCMWRWVGPSRRTRWARMADVQPGQGRSRLGWASACALATGALLYTHYLGFFLAAFMALVVVSRGVTRRSVPAAVPILAALVASLPLLPFAIQRLGLGPERDQHFVPLPVIFTDLIRGLTFGVTADYGALAFTLPVLVILLVVGALAAPRRAGAALLLGYLLVPPLGLYVLTHLKPVYMGIRHILPSAPALHVLLAAGLVALASGQLGVRRILTGGAALRQRSAVRAGWPGRAAPTGHAGWPVRVFGAVAAFCLGLTLAAGIADANVAAVSDPSQRKDDLRSLADYVARHSVEGDVLVLSDPVLEHAFSALSPGVPVTSAPLPGDPRPLDAQLGELASRHDRIWFMTPGPEAQNWLEANMIEVDRRSFHGRTIPVRVRAYERPGAERDWSAAAGGLIGVPAGSEVEASLNGAGYRLRGWQPPEPVQPGGIARVPVQLEVVAVPASSEAAREPASHLVLVLRNKEGREVARADQAPFHGLVSTSDWRPGETLSPSLDLAIEPALVAGEYALGLQAYDDGLRAPAAGELHLGSVTVGGQPLARRRMAFEPPIALTGQAGTEAWVGADVPAGEWVPGDRVSLRAWLASSGDGPPEATALRWQLLQAESDQVASEATSSVEWVEWSEDQTEGPPGERQRSDVDPVADAQSDAAPAAHEQSDDDPAAHEQSDADPAAHEQSDDDPAAHEQSDADPAAHEQSDDDPGLYGQADMEPAAYGRSDAVLVAPDPGDYRLVVIALDSNGGVLGPPPSSASTQPVGAADAEPDQTAGAGTLRALVGRLVGAAGRSTDALAAGLRDELDAGDRAIASVHVRGVERISALPEVDFQPELVFAEAATLAGVSLRPLQPVAGMALTVDLYWRPEGQVEAPLHVSLQLLPPADAVDGRPVAQSDGVPSQGARPTTGWQAGEYVQDSRILDLPANLPDGTYRLAVTFYDPISGQRVPLLEGTQVGESLGLITEVPMGELSGSSDVSGEDR